MPSKKFVKTNLYPKLICTQPSGNLTDNRSRIRATRGHPPPSEGRDPKQHQRQTLFSQWGLSTASNWNALAIDTQGAPCLSIIGQSINQVSEPNNNEQYSAAHRICFQNADNYSTPQTTYTDQKQLSFM